MGVGLTALGLTGCGYLDVERLEHDREPSGGTAPDSSRDTGRPSDPGETDTPVPETDSDSSSCLGGTTPIELASFETGQTGTTRSSWEYDGLLWTTGGLTGRYPACESSYLRSPPVDLSSCQGTRRAVALVFEHDHYFQEQISIDGSPSWPDGGVVQLSRDGVTWQSVDLGTDARPISGDYGGCDDDILADGEVGFVGEMSGWRTTTLQIEESYRTDGFQVRFVFGSDGTSGATPEFELGWFIRDVSVVVTAL